MSDVILRLTRAEFLEAAEVINNFGYDREPLFYAEPWHYAGMEAKVLEARMQLADTGKADVG